METRLGLSAWFSLMLACAACSAADNRGEVTDSASVDKHRLSLIASGDSCSLKHEAGGESEVKDISPKPPCYFLRRGGKEPQSFAYEDVGVKATLVVMGTPVSKENRATWNLDEDAVCGEETQGILVKDSGVTVTEKALTGGVWCRDEGADEKDYWHFAH